MQQLLLLQSCLRFLSPPTLFFHCAPFSFIHSYFTASTATESSHRARALPHYNLSRSASICIPLAFLPLGILLLSLPLSPCAPPSLCLSLRWCHPVSSFFLLAHVRLIGLPILLPNSLCFLYFSLSLVSFCLPPQSLVMRCDKP